MEVTKPNAERLYLENVLGVRAFLSPQGWQNAESAAPEAAPFVSVISAKALSPAAHELLAKMLAAIEVKQFTVSHNIDLSPGTSGAGAYILLGDNAAAVANLLGAAPARPVLHLPDIEVLVVDPDSFETKNLKMKIWQELKQFKNALDKII